ncbi:MAG: rod shape-determining protein MreD [Chloroflexota bacterium]
MDNLGASNGGVGLGILPPRRPPLFGTGELPDITYTSALLAILAGVIHAGLTPVIQVAGVYPNLALVAVVLVTVVFGFTHGTIWAFAAGLTANLVVSAPLGSLPLTLLLVAVLVAAGDRVLGRLTWVYPVLAAFAASIVADAATLAISRLVGEPVAGGDALALMLPAAVLNAVLAGLLFPLVRLLAGRLGLLEERPAW